jgi:AraC family ethanolamine operon transcriptional activator
MPYSETLNRLPLPKTPVHALEGLERDHSYQKLFARDVDEHAANLGKWNQNYDQISSGSFRGTLSEVWIGDMQIFREVTTQAVVEQGQAWAGARLFGVPMAMNGGGTFCDRPLHGDSMFSFGPGSEFSLQSPKEFDVVGIAIREDAYQQVVASLAGAGSKRLLSDDPAVMRCPTGLAELRVFLDSLFEVLDGNPAMLSHPTVQKTVHSALMGHLCDSIQTARDLPAHDSILFPGSPQHQSGAVSAGDQAQQRAPRTARRQSGNNAGTGCRGPLGFLAFVAFRQ